MDELVQYYIVNKDLGMSSRKIAAQVAHVATIIASEECENSKFSEWYIIHNQKKIILGGHKKVLEKLVEQGFYYIKDNGLTEIPPNSLTCVGLGVMTREEAKPFIKRLQLL
jgi:peptidyl-tRNA hydrolase